MRLTVWYSPYYPADRCWIWEVSAGYGRKWAGQRPAYPEALELGLEALAAQVDRADRERL